MKKITFMILGLVLAFNLCACSCSNREPATTPTTTTQPTTPSTAMPTDTITLPVPETNIPDPSVDTSIPEGTMGGGTNATGESNATDGGMRKIR